MARVKAQLRRFIRYNDGSGQSSEDTLEIAGLVLNRIHTNVCTGKRSDTDASGVFDSLDTH